MLAVLATMSHGVEHSQFQIHPHPHLLILSHLLTKKLPDDINALGNVIDFFLNGRTVDCFLKWKYGSLRTSIRNSKQIETKNSFS